MKIGNGNNEDRRTNEYHAEVEERLKWWAEKHGKTIEEAREQFTAYLLTDLGISEPSKEDDDFLIEAAESFMVERRVMSSTSSANAVALVGFFTGFDSKVRDAQERKRAPAVSAALNDLNDAIATGLVARAYTEDGVWMLEKADGPVKTEESADEKPWFLFEEHGLSLLSYRTTRIGVALVSLSHLTDGNALTTTTATQRTSSLTNNPTCALPLLQRTPMNGTFRRCSHHAHSR